MGARTGALSGGRAAGGAGLCRGGRGAARGTSAEGAAGTSAAAATALAGCACFALLLNVSPTFAGAVYQVPVLGQLARVITVKEYSINDRDHLIDVRLPALELAANTDLEQRVNTEIRTRIDQVLQEAEDRARETREAYVATGGAQSDFIPIIITVDYEIKCQNGQYLSFVLTKTETLASAYTEVYTYNIRPSGPGGRSPCGICWGPTTNSWPTRRSARRSPGGRRRTRTTGTSTARTGWRALPPLPTTSGSISTGTAYPWWSLRNMKLHPATWASRNLR